MKAVLNRNGSIDIIAGSIRLTGGYPAIDGVPVRPLRVDVCDGVARFELDEAWLEVAIAATGDGAELRCRAGGLHGAHDISPLAGAAVSGCTRAFKQGMGLGGPSGFARMDEAIRSNAVIAVGDGNSCLTIHVCDQNRFRSHYLIDGGRLSAIMDTEGALREGEELPAFVLREGADFDSALRRCAGDIARFMHARTPSKPAFHWCSWYYLYHNLDQRTLEQYVSGFDRHRDIAPFSHIQIDAGYFPSCGDWLEPNHLFPEGLQRAAKTILDAGYKPGIWVGPFMVGDESRLCREHPDWLLHDADGSLHIQHMDYNEPKLWGLRDCNYYVLDTSHPAAMEYVYNVFSTLRSWGYSLFKTDFLFWGWHDSTRVRRHTPGRTSFEYFRDVMQTIRSAIGDDAAWLGCIAPFMPSLGYVDMIRIGGDVGAQWEEGMFGPVNMIQEIAADQYFNNVYWQNDPDAVLLRDFHIHLKPHQIESLALLQAVSGGVITTSDPIHSIAPERRELLELIRPCGVADARWPYWDSADDLKIVTARAGHGMLAYFFNPSGRDITTACDWARILGAGEWHLTRLHGDTAPASAVPCLTVPAQSGVLFFAAHAPLPRAPRNLWDWSSATE